MVQDILLYETGNGGDLSIYNNDLELCQSIYQMVYLCFFGGNVEQSTKGNELPNDQRADWWANALLFANNKAKQFNSETEKTLNNVALNSSGRISILRAAEADLSVLKNIAVCKVDVILQRHDKVEIQVRITKPILTDSTYLQIIWDAVKNEVITKKIFI